MKVVFLDIDGVLNCASDGIDKVNKRCVNEFNKIIDQTDAKIVISSSWRDIYKFDELCNILHSNGLKGKIIGKTPSWKTSHNNNIVGAYGSRAEEIREWLEENKELDITKYAVLDDGFMDREMEPNFVQTDLTEGLDPDDVIKCVKILNDD